MKKKIKQIKLSIWNHIEERTKNKIKQIFILVLAYILIYLIGSLYFAFMAAVVKWTLGLLSWKIGIGIWCILYTIWIINDLTEPKDKGKEKE